MVIMDKKYILIILVVAVIAVVGGYFLLNGNNSGTITSEHTTIVLSKSSYMEVPKDSNATSKADKKGIFYYVDENDDINITSCSNLSASSSVKEMQKLKNAIATGAKKVKDGDVVVYEKDGVYSVFVKNTQYNDTLLIQSTDKNLLLQCWNSVKYHDPTDKIKFNDTTTGGSGSVVNAVEKTESAVETSSSSSGSSGSSSYTSTESSSSDYSGSGSGGYSDFGFSTSDSGGSSSSGGSSGGGYSDFGFK
jgi:hypothetical protein